MKVILHVDMDSFFSAVEVRETPELKGLPVIVGGGIRAEEEKEKVIEEHDKKIRGVVSTCSYEARAYGIHSAMPLSKAYELCTDAKFLPVNMPLYKRVSGEIMVILRKYADKIEQVSIDEAFLDVSTKVRRDWNDAREYAQLIKREILEKEELTCSIGIAPNKTIAKIASDFVKPDGLTVVEQEKAKEFLAPLPVKKIPGVGPKTEEMLKQMDIEQIKVKFEDFAVHTRAKTLKSFPSDLNTLRKTAKELMTEFIEGKGKEKEKGKKIRLLGVRVSNLDVVDEKQRRIV